MESESTQNRITFAYERAPSKPTIAVTGALGGPSPDARSVVAHLFVEHGSVPVLITHPIGDDGVVDMSKENADPVSRGDATREVQATLVLSPEAAVSVGEWLANHGREAIKRRKALEG